MTTRLPAGMAIAVPFGVGWATTGPGAQPPSQVVLSNVPLGLSGAPKQLHPLPWLVALRERASWARFGGIRK